MKNEAFIVDIIDSLPGISGAILLDAEQGILAQRMEDAIVGYRPEAIGARILSIAGHAADQIVDLTSIQINFNSLLLSCRLLPDQQWLCLLHAPDLSPGMINMALQMAIHNNATADEEDFAETYASEEELVADTESDDQFADTDDAMADEPAYIDTEALTAPDAPLAKPLNRLQDELANYIGPAAPLVFHELLATWCRDHAPSMENIPQLVSLMEQEIDDPEELKTFRSNLPSLLS